MATDKRALAELIEGIDSMVRRTISNPVAGEHDIDACIELADTMTTHWDSVIKPLLRKAL